MADREADVAVIGCGIVGLCLADALSRFGHSVLCFERAAPGAAQSGGVTRIFRPSHADARLVRLALESREAWNRLERRVGETLVGVEGVVMLGASGEDLDRLRLLGAAVEMLSPAQLRERLPLSEGVETVTPAVLDCEGGAIRASRAVASLYDLVKPSVRTEQVYGLARDERGVTVFSSRGTSVVGEAFVTAGAETARLARIDGIEIPERRACHARLTFSVLEPHRLPCLLDRTGMFGETVYGSPTPDGIGYAIGISSEDGCVQADELVASDPTELGMIARRTEAYAKRAFPGALGSVIDTRLCLATPLTSGDDDFGAWRRDGVTYVAGHNLFKFAPTIGELLAASVMGGELPEIFASA
jgi:sarcosine oxidase